MIVVHVAIAVVVVLTGSAVVLTAAVSATVVNYRAGHDARAAARLPRALRLLEGVQLADLLLLKLLQVAALALEQGDVVVPLAVGAVAGLDGVLLLLARLGEKGAQRLDLPAEFLRLAVELLVLLGELFVLVPEVVELFAGVVASVDDVAVLSKGDSELLLEDGDLLLEGTVAPLGIVTGPLGLTNGLGELERLRAELSNSALVPGDLVLQVGDLALDVDDIAALSLDVILECVPLGRDETELVVLVVELGLESLDLDSHVAELLRGCGDLSLRLLKAKVQIGVVRLDVTQTCGLVLDLVAQTLNRGDVVIALNLDRTKEIPSLVGLTLDSVKPLGKILQLSCCLGVPVIGTLEFILQAVLLVQEFGALVLKGAVAVGEGGVLLTRSLQLSGKVGDLRCQVAVVTLEVPEVASLPLEVVDGAVALRLPFAQLGVASLKIVLVGVVVELQAGEGSLQGVVVFARTLLSSMVRNGFWLHGIHADQHTMSVSRSLSFLS